MNTIHRIAAVLAIAIVTVSSVSPTMAKVYRVNFAGKVVEVDCPESPEGHNLTWVNQNCTAVRVSPGGLPSAASSRTTQAQ